MKPEELINWGAWSRLLAGSRQTVRRNSIPKKHIPITSDVMSSGYVIRFGEPDMNGRVFTKNSFDYSQFDKMKERGDIVDYSVDDKGVKIIKRISKND